ncbi:hypothetical protein EMIT0196P_150020 [Pseudomonas chlororaphis]
MTPRWPALRSKGVLKISPACRSWLASDEALKIAFAGKPAPTGPRGPAVSCLTAESPYRYSLTVFKIKFLYL